MCAILAGDIDTILVVPWCDLPSYFGDRGNATQWNPIRQIVRTIGGDEQELVRGKDEDAWGGDAKSHVSHFWRDRKDLLPRTADIFLMKRLEEFCVGV